MKRFFKKLFKRGDFMTRADKAYYGHKFKTIFWSVFSLFIISWVGTNLVLCALTTNVSSNWDIIYQAPNPTVLPIGKEVNAKIRNLAEYTESANSEDQKVNSIVFDKFTGGKVDVYKDASGKNLIDGAERVALNVDDEVYLYRANDGADLYILSNKDIYANEDSSCMFRGLWSCKTITFNNFFVDNVVNMSYMFAGGIMGMEGRSVQGFKTLDLSGWNTGKVTDMSYMFYCCSALTKIDFAGWDTRNVKTMDSMFCNLPGSYGSNNNDYGIELDLSSFDTRSVKDMTWMFYFSGDFYSAIQTIYVSDRFVMDQVEEYSGMFTECIFLVGGQGTAFSYSNDAKAYARIDDPDNGKPGYFTEKPYSGRE